MNKTSCISGFTAATVVAAGVVLASPAQATNWDAIAQCESGGNWSISTGNGYYGGLQFSLSTWRAYGGTGMPNNASRSEQIRIAEKVKAGQGIGAWPTCGGRGYSEKRYKPSEPRYSAPAKKNTYKAPASSYAPTKGSGNVTVKPGDTLSSIAAAYGKSWKSVYQTNKGMIGSNPDLIFPGQKLVV